MLRSTGATRRIWGSCDGRDKQDTQREVLTKLVLVLSMSTRVAVMGGDCEVGRCGVD